MPHLKVDMASRFGLNSRSPIRYREDSAPLATELQGPASLLDLLQEADGSEPQLCRVVVEHFTTQNWGKRHGNEDRVMYHEDKLPNGSLSFHCVGVMDGHDTEVASDHVSRCLPLEVSRLLKEGYSVVDAYKKCMEILEAQLKQVTASAGTCVLSCTLAGRFVWCANLGDCRAMLVSLVVPDNVDATPQSSLPKPQIDRIVWLSRDHKASLPYERERIANVGGTVVDGRVGGLEPSRTLGDFDVKAGVNPDVISIVPDIKRHELGNGTDISQALIICATDGVWDLLSGTDICNLVVARNQIVALQSAMASSSEASIDTSVLRALAEDCVQFSVAKGSRDDCTAIVTFVSVPPCGVMTKTI